MSSDTENLGPLPDDWRGEPRIATFFIPATESIPFPHGATFTFFRGEDVDWLKGVTQSPTTGVSAFPQDPESDGKNWVTFKIWREKEKLGLTIEPFERACRVLERVVPNSQPAEQHGSSPELEQESFSTVFEANTPLLPVMADGAIDLSLSIDAAFDRCMEHLGELIRAYIAMSKDLRATPPNRNTLFVLLPWTTRTPDASVWGGVGLYKPNTGVHILPAPTGTLSDEDMTRLPVFLRRLKSGDPTSVFVQRARAAARAFWIAADYATTVTEAHTSSEVLFDAVLLFLAWEEGTSPEDAASWFGEGLSKRLRTRYGPRIGGNWDTKDRRGVIGHWAICVRDIRNRVVHQGYWPNEAEAWESLRVNDTVEEHAKRRLVHARNAYPRATLMILGRPGLERRGAFAGKIKRFHDTVAVAEPDWLDSYKSWSELFEKERSAKS